ncbi:MAG: Flp pilus assembly complex ATPase component TadA [Candidatus Riflebacteria bacterium]|nr:Flp pilus assembly complex ATPase component TadA [Candidatus Riflebacteria bacterium]
MDITEITLPYEFKPGVLDKIFHGLCPFKINAESIEIINHRKRETIVFSDCKHVEEKGRNKILFVVSENESLLKLPESGGEVLSKYINELYHENIYWKEHGHNFQAVQEFIDLFNRIINWKSNPYIRAVELLQTAAATFDATDIHLEPQVESVSISIRSKAELTVVGTYQKKHHKAIVSRLKYLSGCKSHIAGVPQQGSWTGKTGDLDIRFSVFPTIQGERVSLRFIKALSFSTFESLGWCEDSIKLWRKMIQNNKGLFLIVGPIGSGKTTTLYASLSELARSPDGVRRRIASIEDPVEARISDICQSNLNSEIGMGMSDSFKHLLRQDPDVIALGEIRDIQSLRECLQCGLAGQTAFATFHSSDAVGAVERIKQMGIEDHLIKSGLSVIVHVQLERKEIPETKKIILQSSVQFFTIGNDGLEQIV